MRAWKRDHRGAGLFLVLAIAVHGLLIMIPVAKKMAASDAQHRSLEVRLMAPPKVIQPESPPEPLPEPLPPWSEPDIPVLESLPPVPEAMPSPVQEVVRQAPAPNSTRVLSSQFDYERSVQQPLFGPVNEETEKPDFYYPQRPTLETVLNQPSLQLPFEDTRIYLVDHYEAGVMGGIEKFWDRVTVPFGFTTRNNTRVQCAWVLVIAGCAWGHKTLFHRPARYREQPESRPIEKS